MSESSSASTETRDAEPADTEATDTEGRDDAAGAAGESVAEPADPAATAEPAKQGRFPLRLSVTSTAVLAVLLVVGLAGTVVFGVLYTQAKKVESASAAALATARAYAVTMTSYDFKSIDKNIADTIDGATGEFKDQYSSATAAVKELIQKAQAVATAKVTDAAVKSATEDTVDVLVFVDQSVTNAAVKEPRNDRNRVTMSLQRQGDRWLVSKVDAS